MTQRHIKFPDIEQFRSVVRNAPKKTIEFTGTVKLHGSNASVVMTINRAEPGTPLSDFYAQSRNNVITIENDNAGFARFAHNIKDFLATATDFVDGGELAIFGEWCGKGIQKSVGIAQVEKMFVVFAVKADDKWIDPEIWSDLLITFFAESKNNGFNVFNIYDFLTYKIDIDFLVPEFSVNDLGDLTKQVEERCPVASAFGVDGVGEGIVWSNFEHQLIFKVKGEKHSVSRVRTLAPVDTEKLNSITEFLDYALTENRLLQAQTEITPTLDIKHMGDFIRWVFNDIVKEESDVLAENGIDAKDVSKYVSIRSRNWFMNKLEI